MLEGLAKGGIPSRADITDAAMGERVEFVRLNKELDVIEAVCALDVILGRLQGHLQKKRLMLRALGMTDRFLSH